MVTGAAPREPLKVVLFVCMALLWLTIPKKVWQFTVPGPVEMEGGVAATVHVIGILAYLFYALLAFFVLSLLVTRRAIRQLIQTQEQATG